MSRLCSSLKQNENVVFMHYSDIYKKKIPMDGNVISVQKNHKCVAVCYLEGYRSISTSIPYKDMLAVYDKNGKHMKFENISGPSQKLIHI